MRSLRSWTWNPAGGSYDLEVTCLRRGSMVAVIHLRQREVKATYMGISIRDTMEERDASRRARGGILVFTGQIVALNVLSQNHRWGYVVMFLVMKMKEIESKSLPSKKRSWLPIGVSSFTLGSIETKSSRGILERQ